MAAVGARSKASRDSDGDILRWQHGLCYSETKIDKKSTWAYSGKLPACRGPIVRRRSPQAKAPWSHASPVGIARRPLRESDQTTARDFCLYALLTRAPMLRHGNFTRSVAYKHGHSIDRGEMAITLL